MASALMINDRLQIDKFNPTTWTGDYGINHDGFRKDLFIDGSYMTGINEVPVDYSDDLRNKPLDLSGNVNLKTINPNYAPHGAFPTRKYEYSDGTVTWYRPQLPWGWMNGGGGECESNQFVNMKKTITERSNLIFIIMIMVVIGLYISKN